MCNQTIVYLPLNFSKIYSQTNLIFLLCLGVGRIYEKKEGEGKQKYILSNTNNCYFLLLSYEEYWIVKLTFTGSKALLLP